jgi:hypothetical protein
MYTCRHLRACLIRRCTMESVLWRWGALSAQKSSRYAGTRRGLQLVGSVREPIYMDISHDAVVRREAVRLTGQHCF